jgi:hypothetical protein
MCHDGLAVWVPAEQTLARFYKKEKRFPGEAEKTSANPQKPWGFYPKKECFLFFLDGA